MTEEQQEKREKALEELARLDREAMEHCEAADASKVLAHVFRQLADALDAAPPIHGREQPTFEVSYDGEGLHVRIEKRARAYATKEERDDAFKASEALFKACDLTTASRTEYSVFNGTPETLITNSW